MSDGNVMVSRTANGTVRIEMNFTDTPTVIMELEPADAWRIGNGIRLQAIECGYRPKRGA